ncbi:MAG TPA: dihydrolipoamide acetyltransferase family protein [Rectinemataceae bacterium]|nr:dihydrolipoamide acetyltransferase family protein [Rectinemataceae bacterium]
MAQILIMPRQGNTVESCIIVRWRAAEGESVAADQVVCEVETDKASFDLPAGSAGTLLKILRHEGDDVPVLEPIAVIGQAGENWQAALGASGTAAAPDSSVGASPGTGPATAPTGMPSGPAAPIPESSPSAPEGGAAVSPRARRLAGEHGIDATALAGSGPEGRVIERDVAAALAAQPPMTAAARAAAARGAAAIPLGGSALGGRVGLSDLAAAGSRGSGVAAGVAAGGAAGGAQAGIGPGPFEETTFRGIRTLIGERMRASLAGTAQLSFNMTAKAERISALRARFKASDTSLGLSGVTIGDLVLYAVSRVLPSFPMANAHLVNGVLRSYAHVHLGLAVDTPRGLMVPVIRNADLLSLTELSAEAKRVATACQSGSINPDELSGSTFTVSNLGAFGIESFTPVLNAPETAILGVCAITSGFAPGPDGSPVPESRMGLSLTVDHQVIDGAPAARLLKAFADAIADIDLLLLK